jgi:hypothetical protein
MEEGDEFCSPSFRLIMGYVSYNKEHRELLGRVGDLPITDFMHPLR